MTLQSRNSSTELTLLSPNQLCLCKTYAKEQLNAGFMNYFTYSQHQNQKDLLHKESDAPLSRRLFLFSSLLFIALWRKVASSLGFDYSSAYHHQSLLLQYLSTSHFTQVLWWALLFARFLFVRLVVVIICARPVILR